MKRLWVILFVLISNVWGQGAYGIYGYRFEAFGTKPMLDSDGFYNNPWDSSKGLKDISIDYSHVLGFGNRWLNNKVYFNKLNLTSNFYLHMGFNSFEYKNKRTHSQDNIDWAIGYGKGLSFSNGISLSSNIEYTFGGLHANGPVYGSSPEHFTVPTKNYFSFNIKIGWGTSSGELGHFGIYNTHYLNRRFINKNGPILRTNEISAEIPIKIVGFIAMALGGNSRSSSSKSNVNNNMICKVDDEELHRTFETKYIDGSLFYKWRCGMGHEYWFPSEVN